MARGPLGMDEILESVGMVGRDHLDIRTVTLGINLRGCRTPEDVVRRITDTAGDLIPITETLAAETGIPIVNRRIAVTPIAWVADRPDRELLLELARALDEAATTVGVDFIGGFSAMVEKHASRIDEEVMAALPEALAQTVRVCGSVNVATTAAGINMNMAPVLDVALPGPEGIMRDRAFGDDPAWVMTLGMAVIKHLQDKGIMAIAAFVEDANSMALLWQSSVAFIQGNFLQQPDSELKYEFDE